MENNNFILQQYLTDQKICDDIINFFENSNQKVDGTCGGLINKEIKDSTDICLDLNCNIDSINSYLIEIHNIIEKYTSIYKFSNTQHYWWGITELFNIQRYRPNQGFYKWHFERANPASSLRHLVFMTYLNDVNDGGETEWYYQKLKIKPKKGLTVIWPVDWTFTHRGIPSKTETKYIITGWFSYKNDRKF